MKSKLNIKNYKFKINKGFSLVELIIYMGLMTTFLVVLLDVFTTSLSTRLSSEATSVLAMDSRFIFSKLAYDIQNADSVLLPATGSSGTTLRLVKNSVTYTYSSSSGKLVVDDGSGGVSLNGSDTDLTGLIFQNVGATGTEPMIKYSVTLRSNIELPGSDRFQTIDSTIGLR